MHKLKSLPKWAQDRIKDAEQQYTGALIKDVHIENNGIKHDKHTAEAVGSIAEALQANAQAIIANADALSNLAGALKISGADIEFGNGISLSDVEAR